MEILDTNPVKDTKDQMSAGNYTCRLSQDLNIGNSSIARSKNETDVRLLVACKAQLSSEVIKWKTESLRLQKERDAARIRMKELDQMVGRYSEKARELESRLSVAEDENKRLKGRSPSSISALKKLSLSLDKFHSYPWSDTQSNPSDFLNNSHLNIAEEHRNVTPQEDWKEVSQQLLEKMKQEMKELQQLSCNLSLTDDNSETSNVPEPKISNVEESHDNIEESLSGLISETISIKQCLFEQRSNLKTLLNSVAQENHNVNEKLPWKEGSRTYRSTQCNSSLPVHSVKPKPTTEPSRHSDDSFREFFTKHLESCQNIDKMSKTMQLLMQSDSESSPKSNRSPTKLLSPKSPKQSIEKEKKSTEEERVCPICQAPFDHSIAQNEFEEHVLNHLEVESASLLDQYVVL